MHVTNLNPADTIGASAWLVEAGGHHILLDAGTHPGEEGREALPLYSAAAEVDVEAIAISHCHHDHCGSLPVALRQFPRARVVMSEPSYYLVERVLHNSVNVMKSQRKERGIAEYPLYHHREIDELSYLFQGFRYGHVEPWGAFDSDNPTTPLPTVSFHHAGHVLGSAGLRVALGMESLFYTGDVCFHDQTLTPKADFEDVQANVLIMETTRGATETPAGFSRDGEAKRLIAAIRAGLERSAGVLVPVFALGRTQEVLGEIALAMQRGDLKKQPVYIGGLGRVFTEIYDLICNRAPNLQPDLNLHEALDLQVLEKKALNKSNLDGQLFVITAGMMSEHTLAHELALRMAPAENHAILFVGYAAPDTPAGKLRAAPRGTAFQFSNHGGKLTRNCEMQIFDLSAHASREELLDFVVRLNPRSVILGHGEPDARTWIEAELHDLLPRLNILQPLPGETLSV
ncbi:MAG: MBL fold metallo-hydrolase [Verrucomicrobiota bacterium]|jgi:Cft2 family RNA processing exonuclease|nr:MBL fold metallo-hydrolase [Verrucomicrobiota bacterium]